MQIYVHSLKKVLWMTNGPRWNHYRSENRTQNTVLYRSEGFLALQTRFLGTSTQGGTQKTQRCISQNSFFCCTEDRRSNRFAMT